MFAKVYRLNLKYSLISEPLHSESQVIEPIRHSTVLDNYCLLREHKVPCEKSNHVVIFISASNNWHTKMNDIQTYIRRQKHI